MNLFHSLQQTFERERRRSNEAFKRPALIPPHWLAAALAVALWLLALFLGAS